MRRRIVTCLPLILVLGTGGCASSAQTVRYEPPSRSLNTVSAQAEEAREVLHVSDPLEGANRRIYKFNAQLDRYVLLPVVDAYEEVVPGFLRRRVSSFFLNLGEINIFANSVLQARPSKATPTLGRFLINSTAGLLGLFDVATGLGFPRQSADFGQTLGTWGLDTGPYLVLPALGPSNLRDAVGKAVDWVAFAFVIPDSVADNPVYGTVRYSLQPIDARYRVPFRYYSTGSPFEYELVRYASVVARRIQVGAPPAVRE
jgi:phospholipid-binding lipoprotein MlaA